jgi:hypothetical protein
MHCCPLVFSLVCAWCINTTVKPGAWAYGESVPHMMPKRTMPWIDEQKPWVSDLEQGHAGPGASSFFF